MEDAINDATVDQGPPSEPGNQGLLGSEGGQKTVHWNEPLATTANITGHDLSAESILRSGFRETSDDMVGVFTAFFLFLLIVIF